ncbi:MAG: hypothetical protein WBA97_39640 [Actinophytocola sp.]|uniref:hypothetical protein n=1 Tax=Actinophytocola sp. TaxID=1872138 RepID=UPI003C708C23
MWDVVTPTVGFLLFIGLLGLLITMAASITGAPRCTVHRLRATHDVLPLPRDHRTIGGRLAIAPDNNPCGRSMNHQPHRPQQADALAMLTDAGAAALNVHPQLWRLVEQRLSGWVFVYEPEKPQLNGACLWSDGWSDSIAIAGETDAMAYRVDPLGQDRWAGSGTLRDMLDAIAELPNPVLSYGWPVLPRAIAPPSQSGPHRA